MKDPRTMQPSAINVELDRLDAIQARDHVHAIPGDGVTGPKIKIPKEARPHCGCTPQLKIIRPEGCLARAAALGPLKDTKKLYELLAPVLAVEDQETLLMVPLDIRFQLRGGYVEVHRGAREHVEVTRVDVFRAAVLAGASYFFAVHGHPSGVAKPSKADVELHREIEKFTRATGKGEIRFLDSVIIGRKQYASIREGKVCKA